MPRKRNPGRCPDDAIIQDETGEVAGYRRIHATLFNGTDTAIKSPGGWPAGGHGACKWSFGARPHPFDIELYEVI